MNPLPVLRLLKNEDRRLGQGHLWIYSNEVDVRATPLKNFEPGEQAIVENQQGRPLGVACVNPHALICARLLAWQQAQFDRSILLARMKKALALRESFFSEPYYRLIYGEGDFLPGLIVDRYGEHLSVELNTAGMQNMEDAILSALEELCQPESILLRNDSSARLLEGLPQEIRSARGEPPAEAMLFENNQNFLAPLRQGQKTGWFFDMRLNRAWLAEIAGGRSVLDVFCYAGAAGLQALGAGASRATFLDASAFALEQVGKNALLQGFQEKCDCLEGDAFALLKQLADQEQRFDLIIVDPPAFIKRKKDLVQGRIAYRRINELAVALLSDDGYLLSASCSLHFTEPELRDAVRLAAQKSNRLAQIIKTGGQGPDHPVHPAIPETKYLKAILARIIGPDYS